LTGNSFAIDRLGTEPLLVSCALDLISSSLVFGDDDYIGCLDGGVSVRARSADLGTAYLGLFPLTQHYSIYQPSTIKSASRTECNTKTNTLEPNTCVNLEVLKTTTNSNTNIYHPNTTIGDDVCLLHVSYNSTLESLPPQLCSQPLTSNSFPAVLTVLGTFPTIPVLLILSLPCFSIKRHRRLSVLLTSSCFLLL
jgi:hypothetical protein